jgi:hypothetical protein
VISDFKAETSFSKETLALSSLRFSSFSIFALANSSWYAAETTSYRVWLNYTSHKSHTLRGKRKIKRGHQGKNTTNIQIYQFLIQKQNY